MKKVFLVVTLVFLFSCKNPKKNIQNTPTPVEKTAKTQIKKSKKGYKLMTSYCYSCHSPNTTSHNEIIAPPMIAVKTRYKKQYESKKEFVNAITNWVQNADKENALMLGAVNKFNVMPKLPFPTKQLEEISGYIYNNEIEKPKWFDEHVKEKH